MNKFAVSNQKLTPRKSSNHKPENFVHCPWLTDLEHIFDWKNKELPFYEHSRLRTKPWQKIWVHIWDEKFSWLKRKCIQTKINSPIWAGISKRNHAVISVSKPAKNGLKWPVGRHTLAPFLATIWGDARASRTLTWSRVPFAPGSLFHDLFI